MVVTPPYLTEQAVNSVENMVWFSAEDRITITQLNSDMERYLAAKHIRSVDEYFTLLTQVSDVTPLLPRLHTIMEWLSRNDPGYFNKHPTSYDAHHLYKAEIAIPNTLRSFFIERWVKNESLTTLFPTISARMFGRIALDVYYDFRYDAPYAEFATADLAYMYARQSQHPYNGETFSRQRAVEIFSEGYNRTTYQEMNPYLGSAFQLLEEQDLELPVSWVLSMLKKHTPLTV